MLPIEEEQSEVKYKKAQTGEKKKVVEKKGEVFENNTKHMIVKSTFGKFFSSIVMIMFKIIALNIYLIANIPSATV